jgi:CRISPR/Cas system-associated exonuclease Cas4 (RecB family)
MVDRIARSPYYQFSEEQIISVESDDGETFEHGRQMFMVELPINIGGRKVFIRGAFDLVVKQKEDGIEIIDWKSGFKKADKFQQELYALVAFIKYWRVSPIRVRFVYTRSGFSEYEDFEETDMLAILQYVAILANAYANETEWAPRFNANCKDCEFRNGCAPYLDAISKLPETPQIDPENWDAIQKWEQHIDAIVSCAKRLAEDLDTMKRGYLKKHGETKTLDGRLAYIGERINRYGIPWDVIKANLDGLIDAQQLVEYISPTQVEWFLTKGVVEGKITAEKSGELMAIFEKQKQPTSKSDTIKFKGEKPKKPKAK